MIEQPLDMPNTAIISAKLAERFMGKGSRGAGRIGGTPQPDSTRDHKRYRSYRPHQLRKACGREDGEDGQRCRKVLGAWRQVFNLPGVGKAWAS
jgi:hypothetical protein